MNSLLQELPVIAVTKYKKVSIIIPAYNEEKTIAEIINQVKCVPLPELEKEIVVVDDGSSDRTREILRATPAIRYIFHERNRGKGGALKTGIENCSGDIILLQDADLEYDPKDYSEILRPILQGKVEFVMGSRFFYQDPKFFTADGAPFFSHFIGNKMITWLTNLLYGQNNTDYEGCYKAFTRSIIGAITIHTDGFDFDNELISKVLRLGYKITEIPIYYNSRLYSQGKKITWRDGLVILWTIIKWRFWKL
jgi:glycosyltransferase involved in cell wall biosynthesis